jgi:DNA-binding GntR family transcriptional regulator
MVLEAGFVDAEVTRGRPRLRPSLGKLGRPRTIRPAALHGVLLNHLRDMIENGALAPGELIVENDLSQRLGVSRTPLREALKVLSSEGLVELRPHRTPIVARVDPDEIEAIFEILEALERLAGRRACEAMTDQDLAELETMHAAMLARHDANDRDGYASINRDIHSRIIELAGNQPLQGIYSGLWVKVRRARSTTNYDPHRWNESDREHEEIMQALRRRSPDESADVLARHTRKTGAAVVRTLRRVAAAAARL